MVKRKSVPPVNPGVTRYEEWSGGQTPLVRGDRVRAILPLRVTTTEVEFIAHVVPDRGVPFIEVKDHDGRIRCIRPDDVKSKVRRRRSR